MSGKKKLHLIYDAPVSLTFSLAVTFILLADTTIFRNHLTQVFFSAPTCQGTSTAFNWKNIFDYIRLFTYVFGHQNWNSFLTNIVAILMLGPSLEERYGSAMIALMMSFAALVTGVINACFIPVPLTGSGSIAFMMIFLAAFAAILRKELPLSFLLIMALYAGRELISSEGAFTLLAHATGGLCGCMFFFLAEPAHRNGSGSHTRRQKSTQKSDESL